MTQTQSDIPTTLKSAQEAMAAARWHEARTIFEAVLAEEETPEALEGLGLAASWLSDEAATFAARERAYQLYRSAGDRAGAARLATILAFDYLQFRGETAVARGWLERARRHLRGLDESKEAAWLAAYESLFVLMTENNSRSARRLAVKATSIARRAGLVDPEMLAVAIEGLALVSEGRIADGMRRLDEASLAAIAGEMTDIDAIATIICSVMDACDRIRDYDRAAEWSVKARELCQTWNNDILMAFCRPHFAVVLTWRGEWQAAEEQLETARREMLEFRPPMAVEAIVRLAELRWRQGRWEEAESLFEQVKQEGLAQLGRAEMSLSAGDTASAVDLCERYLRRIPREDRMERAPGLELIVRALAAASRADEAAPHLQELRSIAAIARTRPLEASAAFAAGVLSAAQGYYDESRRHLEDAADLYARSHAPFETARARLELAASLAALQRIEAAEREAAEAVRLLRSIGAAREAERAVALAARLRPNSLAPDASDGSRLTPREKEVLRLIAQGRSNQEIADDLVLSVRTVERHISTIYEKIGATGRSARAAATAYALKQGLT